MQRTVSARHKNLGLRDMRKVQYYSCLLLKLSAISVSELVEISWQSSMAVMVHIGTIAKFKED